MVELEPGARDIKQRLQETEKRLSDSNADNTALVETVNSPDLESQWLARSQALMNQFQFR